MDVVGVLREMLRANGARRGSRHPVGILSACGRIRLADSGQQLRGIQHAVEHQQPPAIDLVAVAKVLAQDLAPVGRDDLGRRRRRHGAEIDDEQALGRAA